MVSGGSDNPGGLKNRTPRGHLICHDNPRTAPLIPPASQPSQPAASRSQPEAARFSRRRGSWPPAADSWRSPRPHPDPGPRPNPDLEGCSPSEVSDLPPIKEIRAP